MGKRKQQPSRSAASASKRRKAQASSSSSSGPDKQVSRLQRDRKRREPQAASSSSGAVHTSGSRPVTLHHPDTGEQICEGTFVPDRVVHGKALSKAECAVFIKANSFSNASKSVIVDTGYDGMMPIESAGGMKIAWSLSHVLPLHPG